MESLLPILVGIAGAAVIGAVALREHRQLRSSRRGLLSRCAALLDDGKIELGAAEFPQLTGSHDGRTVHAELIPDNMTIRRLPQLWLSVTMLESLPLAGGFAVLVRPSGNDFYSLTQTFSETLGPPRAFPWEVLVRGAGPEDQGTVAALADVIGRILADPKVKEVAVSPKGVRVVRQASEGRRGEHLLLRQAIFDDAAVEPGQFRELLVWLNALRDQVRRLKTTQRAA